MHIIFPVKRILWCDKEPEGQIVHPVKIAVAGGRFSSSTLKDVGRSPHGKYFTPVSILPGKIEQASLNTAHAA
jgi:hypothetical protein